MRGYSQLADIESLLLNIPDKNIRDYAGEAIVSYSAGAYRSAIVSIWITVVYDPYQKFRLLNEQYGDKAAKKCIEAIDDIRSNPDKKQITAWEREILKKAYESVKIITSTEYEHLDRIQKDRHRCAHPVLDDEGFLFQPTPELTRTHIRTAIEVLLSKPPIIGKAAGDALIRDVEETSYFPDDLEGVKKALHKRHFQTSEKYRLNLFKLSLKKILFLEPDDTDTIERYILIFQCLLQEYRQTFESIERESISRIIDKVKEERYNFLLEIIYMESSFWDNTPEFIQEQLRQYCLAKSPRRRKETIELLHAMAVMPELEDKVIDLYIHHFNSITRERFIGYLEDINFIENNSNLLKKMVAYNIKVFCKSGRYDHATSYKKSLIIPVIEMMDEEQVRSILNLSISEQQNNTNDQLAYCTSCYKEIFQKTIDKYPDTLSDWVNFIEKKRERNWSNFEELEELVENKKL
ncbi:MAG: hypothetical protein AAGE84_14855 [Cyanobacteria bacterium P01_G01_bin.39]